MSATTPVFEADALNVLRQHEAVLMDTLCSIPSTDIRPESLDKALNALITMVAAHHTLLEALLGHAPTVEYIHELAENPDLIASLKGKY